MTSLSVNLRPIGRWSSTHHEGTTLKNVKTCIFKSCVRIVTNDEDIRGGARDSGARHSDWSTRDFDKK